MSYPLEIDTRVNSPRRVAFCIVLAGCLAFTPAAFGGPASPTPTPAPPTAAGGGEKEFTVADAQNPVAPLISLPFQNNTYFDFGPEKRTANILAIEPVIPFPLPFKDWAVVLRAVIPLVYEPRVSPVEGAKFGLGNFQPEFYVIPPHGKSFIWGVGPKLFFPTATDSALGVNKFGGGPDVALVLIKGPVVTGMLFNHVWAGDGGRRESTTSINPFFNYNLPGGWYLISSEIITADWIADSHNRWTVPLGGGIGRVFKVGPQWFNVRVQGLRNVVRPDYAPSWQLQTQVQLLFPIKTAK